MTPQASRLVVATANVLCSLPEAGAREALGRVLDVEPDLVGLQEWSLARVRLLRETGRAGLVPSMGVRLAAVGPAKTTDYVWSTPVLGGCAVGARADRFDLLGCHSRVVSGVRRADRPGSWLGVEPARVVTVATYHDVLGDETISLVNYHLTPGIQARGCYREDRPLLVAKHRAEVRRLQRYVDEELALGRVVYALGDSNFDGLRLAGLTSSWQGREQEPGTLGPRRKVDDVHGPARPDAVARLSTGSDHQAVVATWEPPTQDSPST